MTVLNRLVTIQRQWPGAQCTMLLFGHERVAQFEVACRRKKIEKKENILAVWRLSGSVLLQCFSQHYGVVGHEALEMNGTLS